MLALSPESGTAVGSRLQNNGDAYWRPTLSRLKSATDADAAWVIQYDANGRRGRILFAINIPVDFAVSYQERFSLDDPWLQHDYHFQDVGAVVRGSDCIPNEVLETTPFYRGWLAPQELSHLLFGVVAHSGSVFTVIALARDVSKDPFGEVADTILGAILPPTAAAWRLEAMLRSARSETRAVWRTIDQLNCGLLLTTASGRVIGVNQLGREIIETRDGIGLQDGYLVALRYQDQLQLQTALQQLPTASGNGGSVRALAFPRNGKTGPLHVVMTTITDPDAPRGGEPPLIGIFVTDRERATNLPVDLLRDLFGLTRVESEVAALLSEGYSLDEVAQRLHASKHTVRTYLKSIFQKTETHRQVSLVRLILGGVGFVRGRQGQET